ncbi:alpha-E domain-containing protein [Coraliomargarita parva]|uniref:alpha-E domain-containing protein n=1 Tax=Coraliomargarita parva TaxID=3014050 RepID=UPI0022B5BADB|nr:alpha-E domain-containing protein [Coraliomargarita parva]
MLSRVADSLYWMSRYIERAENIARLLDVNLQLLLDFEEMDDDKLKEHWEPVIRAAGEEKQFYELYDQADSQSVTDFLTFNRDNPSSVISCMFAARENARMIRDQISTEMWQCLNQAYLFLKSNNAKLVWESGPYEFYKQIQDYSHLFLGLTDATFSHAEGFHFMQVGKFLERADKTSRILDIKYHILLPSVDEVGGAVDAVQWGAILRSCSAFEAYHRLYVSSVNPLKVSDFLIFNDDFPRSIKFCVRELDRNLHRISGCPLSEFSNSAERVSGRIQSEMIYSGINEAFSLGLHEYLENLQDKFIEIGKAVYDTYMFHPRLDLATEIAAQQQQQQQ